MTLEDPVEYRIPRVTHAQVHPRRGFTFAEGLRCILRQDPNVIMLGEVRDRETAEIAIQAALTGHLIFSTVHATTATAIINRLVNMEVEPYLVSNALLAALAQRLVRRVCHQCAQKADLDPAQLRSLTRGLDGPQAQAIAAIAAKPGGQFLKARGCPACKNTGYKGRVGLFELLVMDDKLRSHIKKDIDMLALRSAAIQGGMQTLLVDGISKAWAGWTTLDEVARVTGEG